MGSTRYQRQAEACNEMAALMSSPADRCSFLKNRETFLQLANEALTRERGSDSAGLVFWNMRPAAVH